MISYAKEHGNRAAQRNFGPDESQVRYWRRQEQRLRSAVGKRKKACLRHGNVKWPDLEKELKDWVVNNRNSGYCDTTKMIMNHSREIARTRGVVGFRGSSSWWVACTVLAVFAAVLAVLAMRYLLILDVFWSACTVLAHRTWSFSLSLGSELLRARYFCLACHTCSS